MEIAVIITIALANYMRSYSYTLHVVPLCTANPAACMVLASYIRELSSVGLVVGQVVHSAWIAIGNPAL